MGALYLILQCVGFLVALVAVKLLLTFLPSFNRVRALGTNSPGFTFVFKKDRDHFWNRLTNFALQQASGWYHLWIGPSCFVLTCDAEAAGAILTAREGFVKQVFSASAPESMKPWSVNNIVAANGDDWKRQRAVFSPAFGTEAYKTYFPTFKDKTDKAISLLYKEALGQEGDVDSQSYMFKFALDVLGESIFHYDFQSLEGGGGEHYQAYENILHIPRNLLWRFFGRYIELFPVENAKKYHAAQKIMKDLFNKMLEERKAKNKSLTDDAPKADILDYILAGIQRDTMTEEEVYGNFWILFIAGHDTTATALSWELQLLVHYPEEQEKIYAEIKEIIGDQEIQWEDLKKFKLLSNFINESLRLYPPVALLPTRQNTVPFKYGDLTVPAGATIGIDIRSIQRSPKYWENPLKFDPDRWAPEKVRLQQKKSRFAFMPFSLGKRECIGNNFSLQEQTLFIATLLLKYKLEKPKHHPLTDLTAQARTSIFNAPEHGWVSIKPRQ